MLAMVFQPSSSARPAEADHLDCLRRLSLRSYGRNMKRRIRYCTSALTQEPSPSQLVAAGRRICSLRCALQQMASRAEQALGWLCLSALGAQFSFWEGA